jgi:hypothetical protein
VDYLIDLMESTEKAPAVKLRPIEREELLILRKTLTELLDKKFIRVSSSELTAPVLFAYKSEGGLRFCINYRALNQIIKKDRFPFFLI